MNLQPLFDHILIKLDEIETRTPGGLLLPENRRDDERTRFASVVAVGPGARGPDGQTFPMVLREGQRILVPAWGGAECKIGGKEYRLIKEIDVLARIVE